jgi:membrane protein
MLKTIRAAIDWARLAITEPISQLSAMQRTTRHWFEVLRYCARHLGEDKAPVLAAALSFRVLFGLVPMLVVATVVSRSVLQDRFPAFVRSIIDELGLGDVSLAATTSDVPSNLGTWMEELVSGASSVNLAALGWVGFVVVAFSALWVLVTIEDGFNHIYRAPGGRAWLRRLLVYWFLLTFPTILLGAIPVITARLDALQSTLPEGGTLASLLDLAVVIGTTWLLLAMAYLWVPNTRVEVRPALIGAFVGAVLIEAAKHLLGVYTTHALTLNKLYGSLGLIPLFMFWMYLMWMFVLFGLEIASIIQTLRGRGIDVLVGTEGEERRIEPSIVIRLVKHVADGFESGRPTSVEDLAQTFRLETGIVRLLVQRLERAGLLVRLEDPDRVTLARPAASIDLEQVLAIGFEAAGIAPGEDDALGLRLRQAQQDAIRGLRLADPIPG